MKKIFLILLAAVLLAGCSDDGNDRVDLGYLELVSSNVEFSYKGGSGEIVVRSPGTITATAASSWVTTEVSGSVVRVTVPVLTDLQTRSSSVLLSNGERSVVVPVSQTSFAVTLSATSLSFAKEAGAKTVSFEPLSVPISAVSTAEWATATVNNDGETVRVSAAENRGNARTAVVTLSGGGPKATIDVSQASALTVASKAVAAKAEAGSYTVAYTAFADAVVSVKSSATWASASVAGGKVTIAVLAAVDAATRTATITVSTDGGASETIAVTQDAIPLTWSLWAEGTFTSTNLGRTKKTTLSKADEADNIFRIDSPIVANYHYVFIWDAAEKSITLTPVGIPFNYYGSEERLQYTGLQMDGYPMVWLTDLEDIGIFFGIDPFTKYDPATKTFTLNVLHTGWTGTDITSGGFYSDDTFVVSKFLKGDPWN